VRSRSCRPRRFDAELTKLTGQVGKTVDPKADIEPIAADLNALDEKLDDAGLLGRK
jgi:hypothetical protein